jgi:hypothetical protein
MTENQEVSCSKCGSVDFEYDSYWKEFTCKKCGWTEQDSRRISLLFAKINPHEPPRSKQPSRHQEQLEAKQASGNLPREIKHEDNKDSCHATTRLNELWEESGNGCKDGDFAPLLEMAQPDLYRRNGFRITELPIDSTALNFSRRQQMVDIAEKTGIELPPGSAPVFAIEEGKDSHCVREAIQRLRDPQSRLVHEFFWFWPHALGQSRTDEALAALACGDCSRATKVWHQQEQNKTESHVSTHNLAVVRHLSALDWEELALSRSLSEEEKEYARASWESAFRRWKLLLKHEAFWSRLTTRIRDMNDPRLTTGTARRIRGSLPLTLLLINARLAVQAAERGNTAEAQRHVGILREWEKHPATAPTPTERITQPPLSSTAGDLPPLADEALRQALEPVRERIKHLSKTAEAEADADPEQGDQPTRRLLEQTRFLLGVVDCLLPLDHPTRIALHDEVALRALGCQIVHGNKTEDWKTAVELIEQILPIAISESARSRIRQNLTTVRNNRDMALCWFCQKNQGDEKCAIEVKMHGDVQRIPIYNGVRVTWRHNTFKVSRCASCSAAHAEQTRIGNIGCGIAFLWFIAIGSGLGALGNFNEQDMGVALSLMAVCGGCIWGIIAAKKRQKKIPKLVGIKPESDYKDYPIIKEMRAKGWNFGEQPNT